MSYEKIAGKERVPVPTEQGAFANSLAYAMRQAKEPLCDALANLIESGRGPERVEVDEDIAKVWDQIRRSEGAGYRQRANKPFWGFYFATATGVEWMRKILGNRIAKHAELVCAHLCATYPER